MSLTKVCIDCKKDLDTCNFSKCTQKKDGLNIRCKQCVKIYKQKLKEQNREQIEYEIYELDLNSTKWQAGKPQGNIREKINNKTGVIRYEVSHCINMKTVSKSFSSTKYTDMNEAYIDAKKYRYDFSTQRGLTKNMIKVFKVDDEYFIEVQLSQGYTMITNIEFSDIVQTYMLYINKPDRDELPICKMYVDGCSKSFHNYITGYKMLRHVNGNTLDNRLSNLEKINKNL